MSTGSTPQRSSDKEKESDPDIVIDITNGKKISISLDPKEWVIILIGACVIIGVLGRTGLI